MTSGDLDTAVNSYREALNIADGASDGGPASDARPRGVVVGEAAGDEEGGAAQRESVSDKRDICLRTL